MPAVIAVEIVQEQPPKVEAVVVQVELKKAPVERKAFVPASLRAKQRGQDPKSLITEEKH